MAAPFDSISSDHEDEIRDLSTTVEEPMLPLYPHVSDDDSPEEEPSEEELMESDPSEDEPMELDPYGDLSPSPVTSATSTSPTRDPSHRARSRGVRTRLTARKTVRIPQVYPNPTLTDTPPARARCRADARRWGWLPYTLQTWRKEEGVHITTEVGESSTLHDLPYTQEPPHHTVPILAVRLNTHERRLDRMEANQKRLHRDCTEIIQEQVSQIDRDQYELRDSLDITHYRGMQTRDEVVALRLRLEQCELRAQEAEQHSMMLEQRLAVTEESLRETARLANAVDRIVALFPQHSQHHE